MNPELFSAPEPRASGAVTGSESAVATSFSAGGHSFLSLVMCFKYLMGGAGPVGRPGWGSFLTSAFTCLNTGGSCWLYWKHKTVHR